MTEPRYKHMPTTRMGRAICTARMATTLGAHASKNAGKALLSGQRPRLENTLLTPQAAGHLAASLMQMRGAAMKLGQLLSLDDTLMLSPELASAFGALRASGYAMSPKQLKQVLTHEWGGRWHTTFSHFEPRPFAAASIGQVHRATLTSGERVAIKVQFPNVRQSIESDLSNLRLLMRTAGLVPKALDLDYYLDLCRDQLMVETDYLTEAANLSAMGDHIAPYPWLTAPNVFADLTTQNILTMSYVEGRDLDSAMREATQEHRNTTAAQIMDLMVQEIFAWRMVQTDPNLANFKYDSATSALVLLDFGSCVEVSARVHRLYRAFLHHCAHNDAAAIKAVLKEEKLLPHPIGAELSAFIDSAIDTILTEIHRNALFDFQSSAVFDLINARDFHHIQMSIPQEPITGDFLFIQRKVIGMILSFRAWGITLPLREMLDSYDRVVQR